MVLYPRSSCHPQAHPRGVSCPHYFNNCKSNYDDRHLLKFADDTVLISVHQDGEVDHKPGVKVFVEWCDHHFLKLNVHKTKDMAIDFRKTSH